MKNRFRRKWPEDDPWENMTSGEKISLPKKRKEKQSEKIEESSKAQRSIHRVRDGKARKGKEMKGGGVELKREHRERFLSGEVEFRGIRAEKEAEG